MWAFQQNIYKTKSVTVPTVYDSFSVESTGSSIQLILAGTSSSSVLVDYADGVGIQNYQSSSYNFVGGAATRTVTYYIPSNIGWGVFTEVRINAGTVNIPLSLLNTFSNLEYFLFQASGTITGDLSDITLTSSLDRINLNGGTQNITGNISKTNDFTNITTFSISGVGNTITGDLANINPTITDFRLHGNNTLSGDLINFTDPISFVVQGNNTITGDIVNINNGITVSFEVHGGNTLYGLIENIGDSIRYIDIQGNNIIGGTLNNLPAGLLIASLFRILGNNTISGGIENFSNKFVPAYTAFTIHIGGNNTISGDIGLVNHATGGGSTQLNMYIYGNNTISNYTSSNWNWSWIPQIEIIPTSGGLDSSEVDNLIIDMDNLPNSSLGGSTKRIVLTGTNSPRTSTSDVARTSLISKGYTVNTNI